MFEFIKADGGSFTLSNGYVTGFSRNDAPYEWFPLARPVWHPRRRWYHQTRGHRRGFRSPLYARTTRFADRRPRYYRVVAVPADPVEIGSDEWLRMKMGSDPPQSLIRPIKPIERPREWPPHGRQKNTHHNP